MELKYMTSGLEFTLTTGSNRTFMELKFGEELQHVIVPEF